MSALKRISQNRNFLSKESTEKLIHTFVSSRIDSCNALLSGIPEKDISKLQIVQNSAARIVERARGRDPITPMLTHLHWLPVDKRIVYKIIFVLLCHKVIIHQYPTYLTNLITPYTPKETFAPLTNIYWLFHLHLLVHKIMGIVRLHKQHQFYGINYLINLGQKQTPVVL